MSARFRNRTEAGRALAAKLTAYADLPEVIVLGLPRGGVPVAFEVANALHAPIDVFVVRKLGIPGHEEYAMGAIASGGVRLLDRSVIDAHGIPDSEIERITHKEMEELARRELQYRGTRPFPDLRGKTVLLVDDGLATGSTMRVAVEALRQEQASRIVVAVPVSSPRTCDAFRDVADEIVCAITPEDFYAVGQWYEDFSQTTDEEVHDLLDRARAADAGSPSSLPRNPSPGSPSLPYGDDRVERTVTVRVADASLEGTLGIPIAHVEGIVLFAHGSGSSRFSSRNRRVARVLRDAGFGTFLLDLLTADEEEVDVMTRHHRFDIGLLAGRLVGAIDWLATEPSTRGLPVGLFGASTGGGAALVAAAARPDHVRTVVSRGGRPDLAGDELAHVRCPTLLIVGERDEQVIELNERARDRMHTDVRIEIVPRATHLFEEPGALKHVATLARDWFRSYLTVGQHVG